jgi:hypothetical protein
MSLHCTTFFGEYYDYDDGVAATTRDCKLVVILPVLNEAATITQVIKDIPRDLPGVSAVEVVVVDDGSTDDSASLARVAGARVVCHRSNLGVGAALATGIEVALELGADVIVNMDADGQFNPRDMAELVRLVKDEGYGLATCTRFAGGTHPPGMPAVRVWGNRLLARVVNWIIWGGKFSDVSCGFRAYSREAALKLHIFSRFTYTHESLINLAAKGVHMVEAPLPVRGVRAQGKSRVAASVWMYGCRALTILVRAMRDTRPLKFFGIPAIFLVLMGTLTVAVVRILFAGSRSPVLESLALSVGTISVLFGLCLGIFGLLSDQLARLWKAEEKALYYTRLQYFDRNRSQLPSSESVDPADPAFARDRGHRNGRISSRAKGVS